MKWKCYKCKIHKCNYIDVKNEKCSCCEKDHDDMPTCTVEEMCKDMGWDIRTLDLES